MHRMNANRVTQSGTSTLDDASLDRIQKRVKDASNKRIEKHKKSSSVKKTAKKNTSPSVIKGQQSNNKRIIIASLDDIPATFERIGTGFFRQGHHLWEMTPGDGGYILVRKHGEDHVLGYDPQPVEKTARNIVGASGIITDRNGIALKRGSRVCLPMGGKIANGTVIVLTPEALGVDLDNGGQIDIPSDMVESMGGPGLEEELEEELEELTAPSGDKEGSGDIFNPEIEEKSTSDHVGPSSAQSGGVGGNVSADHSDPDGGRNVMASRVAQTEPVVPAPAPAQGAPEFETFEPADARSSIATRLDNMGPDASVSIFSEDQNRYWYAKKAGDEYALYIVETNLEQMPDIKTAEDLARFEQNVGQMQFTADRRIASSIEALIKVHAGLVSWNEYWRRVGQRVAEKAPPKPKMTDAEKREKSKLRRQERATERKGLPPGTKLPPRAGRKGSDEVAILKEYNKLYEQTLDGINHALDTVSDQQDDVLVADEIGRVMDEYVEEKARLDDDGKEQLDEELSLDSPSQAEIDGIDITRTSNKQVSKIVVSMSDL